MCVRPCFPALHGLPPEVLKIIIKYLGVESLKSMRHVCRFLHQYIEQSEQILFKEWRLRGEISAVRLELFSDEVATITSIEILQLSGESCAVDDSLVHLVSSHPEIRSVRICSSNCADRSLRALMSNPDIVAIKLDNSQVTGENLELESGFNTNLEVLNFKGCKNLTGTGLQSILDRTSGAKVKELNLSRTNISLEHLTTSLPNLEILQLYRCENLTDEGLVEFLNNTGGSLKELHLSSTSITLCDTSLLNISLSCLELLDLAYCHHITDLGLISLLNKTGEGLKRLTLTETPITLSEVDSIATHFPSLEELDLSFCFDISEDCLIRFLRKIGTGLNLNLEDTYASVDNIRAQFPRINSNY